jgi:phosphorylcholine metabolism protein LicD
MSLKYKLKRIKLIYYPYKKVRDFFDYFKRKKRNRDIKKYGYEMLDCVCKKMKKNSVPVFCAFGTMLGFVRDNGFISHDLDIDLGILCTDKFSWDEIDMIAKESGLKLKHQFILDNGTITERTYYKASATIDFFLYYVAESQMYSYSYVQETYSKKFMVLKTIVPLLKEINYKEVHNIEVPIISNYEEYLTSIYGKNWQIPDPGFKHKVKPLPGRYATIERFK